MTAMDVHMAQRGIVTIPKSLRDSYDLGPGDTFTLIDPGGVFLLNPQRSEIDVIADRIAGQWREKGETLETMLEALREERERA
jgi:AbrB family looped-hinge helix DNA binding protein